jgi:hypothetical protein
MSKHKQIAVGVLLIVPWLVYSGWWLHQRYARNEQRKADIAAYLRGPYTAPVLNFPDTREYLKNFVTVQYKKDLLVPVSGVVSIRFHDLYPGELNWRDGGCTWIDKTQLGALMTVIPGNAEESIKAIPGHTIEYQCHWSAPRKQPLDYHPQRVTQ